MPLLLMIFCFYFSSHTCHFDGKSYLIVIVVWPYETIPNETKRNETNERTRDYVSEIMSGRGRKPKIGQLD